MIANARASGTETAGRCMRKRPFCDEEGCNTKGKKYVEKCIGKFRISEICPEHIRRPSSVPGGRTERERWQRRGARAPRSGPSRTGSVCRYHCSNVRRQKTVAS